MTFIRFKYSQWFPRRQPGVREAQWVATAGAMACVSPNNNIPSISRRTYILSYLLRSFTKSRSYFELVFENILSILVERLVTLQSYSNLWRNCADAPMALGDEVLVWWHSNAWNPRKMVTALVEVYRASEARRLKTWRLLACIWSHSNLNELSACDWWTNNFNDLIGFLSSESILDGLFLLIFCNDLFK